jgi:hypothetical protein
MKKKIESVLEVIVMILLVGILVQTCNLKQDIREYKNQVLKSR